MAPEKEFLAGLIPPVQADVWVADDDAGVRLLLSRAFKRVDMDLSVQFFSNGAEVVRQIRADGQAPRVLLLDFDMPMMNGLEAFKTLRAEGYLSQITVVMFSSFSEADVVKEAYAAGARFYVTKPARGEDYRDVAKLCYLCLHEPPGPHEEAWSNVPLPVGRALEIALSNIQWAR